jgi:hypothetical protein
MNSRIALVATMIVCGCGEHAPPPPDRPTTTAATPAAPQDTGFVGTTAVTQRVKAGARQAALHTVETTEETGYDRVVFEFAGDSVPGYHVEYATQTVRRCGSGDAVTVKGASRLIVRFEPARAHDNHGQPVGGRERTLRFPAVTEMKLICDFEGQIEWVLGVTRARAAYRVRELAAPARLVLEIRHAP